MNIKIKHELSIIVILSLVLLATIYFVNQNLLRIILGFPFVLFFPGYALIAALFVKKTDIGAFERIVLSFGFSVITVPAIGIILNYTPWGIKLLPMLISILLFIIAMSLIALVRRRGVPQDNRYEVAFNFNFSGGLDSTKLDRILSVLLVSVIVIAIGGLIFVIAMPKDGEKYTEFYLLGAAGKAADYPSSLILGENATVTLGLINRQGKDSIYKVSVRLNNISDNVLDSMALQDGGKYEKVVTIIPRKIGENQKVDFILYVDGVEKPDLALHFWLNVK